MRWAAAAGGCRRQRQRAPRQGGSARRQAGRRRGPRRRLWPQHPHNDHVMSRRRSSRARPQATAANMPASVRVGLTSLIQGNERAIASMLDMPSVSEPPSLLGALAGVMSVNSLSAEGLLAQWFGEEMLGCYAARIGKSGKGNAATLAARISGAWGRPGFRCPSPEQGSAGKEVEAGVAGTADWAQRPPKRPKVSAAAGEVAAAVAAAAAATAPAAESGEHAALPPARPAIRGILQSRVRDGVTVYKVRFRGAEAPPDAWVDARQVTAAQVTNFLARKAKKLAQVQA